ncbi:MAG: hemerythrin domain-containing protein [Myxococcales bacterium]|nr:hemerythrin domain-containing protein [Myxococcales bacterium]
MVAALLACHERIHRFTALAARLGTPDGTAAERAEAAAGVVRYFTVALPLHAADEDASLAPRLAGGDPAVDAALAQMTAEHVAHAAPLARVVDAARTIVAAPATVPPDLAAAAAALAALFTAHLALEERAIFPAIAALPAEVQATIRAEMLARRR